ncbi:hypothetical protein WDU94_005897 [Cyamophila willieti]
MLLYVVAPLRRSTAEAFQILISHAFGDAGSPYLIGLHTQICLNLNWSIVADMLLYVVAPLRRSTAEAFQILISHAFGDAGSPYLIGLLSEMFRQSLGLAGATVASSAMLLHTHATSPSPPVLLSSNSTTLTPIQSSGDRSSDEFLSLQYALFITSFVESINLYKYGIFSVLKVLGGVFFLLTSLYIVDDRTRAEREISGKKTKST